MSYQVNVEYRVAIQPRSIYKLRKIPELVDVLTTYQSELNIDGHYKVSNFCYVDDKITFNVVSDATLSPKQIVFRIKQNLWDKLRVDYKELKSVYSFWLRDDEIKSYHTTKSIQCTLS